MTMTMDLIRHIAGLYSGKAIKGDFTQVYITGNEIWMAQQILASQHTEQAEGAQGEPLPYWEPCNPACDPELNGFRDRKCSCAQARAALAQPSRAQTYSPQEVRSGTGWPAGARFSLAQPSPAPELDDQAFDANAERLTLQALGPGAGINPEATSIDDIFIDEAPAPTLPERGTQHRFSTTEQTCRHDFAGVWWNDNDVVKTGRECRHCGFFVEDAAEAPERPEQPKRYTADVFYHNHFSTVQMEVVRASHFDEFVAQHERIVGALWANIGTLMETRNGLVEEIGHLHSELCDVREERDAAQAGQVPDGWKLVPIEPTQAMFESARISAPGSHTEKLLMASYWRNMVAATPQPVRGDGSHE